MWLNSLHSFEVFFHVSGCHGPQSMKPSVLDEKIPSLCLAITGHRRSSCYWNYSGPKERPPTIPVGQSLARHGLTTQAFKALLLWTF